MSSRSDVQEAAASVWSQWLFKISWLKVVVFIAALTPFLALVQGLFASTLGPNPVDALTDHTGTLALRMLLFSLALTPLRYLIGQTWPLRLRRMLGLFAFFYAMLHVVIYVGFDLQLDVSLMLDDLSERPFIMAGAVGFVLLVPLAATSTRGMIRRLGRRWNLLHRAVYISATAAVVHYVWLARGDQIEPLIYLWVLLVLFSYRLVRLVR